MGGKAHIRPSFFFLHPPFPRKSRLRVEHHQEREEKLATHFQLGEISGMTNDVDCMGRIVSPPKCLTHKLRPYVEMGLRGWSR